MGLYNAQDIIDNIELYEEKIQNKINKDFYSRTIEELQKVGFEYFHDVTKKGYELTNENNKNIINTTGNILVYKCIIIAVTDKGVYMNKPINLNDKLIELSFEYYIEFNNDMYENICKVIKDFTV